jgi:hypothetical protein
MVNYVFAMVRDLCLVPGLVMAAVAEELMTKFNMILQAGSMVWRCCVAMAY